MRVQLEPAGAPAALPPHAARRRFNRSSARPAGESRRLDWFEIAALSVFAAISVWVLGLDLIQVIRHGQVWTGTDGIYIVDQMQYLAWIRDASHHLLASNLFVLRHTAADYFQPAIAVSGGLVALGVAPWVALLLWKPVAVLVAFWGVREYVRRSVTELGARRAALALAVFFGSFSVVYGSPGMVGDLFLGFLSWGYTFGLLALGAMILALLAYDRARSASGSERRRKAIAAALLGALASSLHPWQGELLILAVISAELVIWRGTRVRPGIALLATTLIATCLPLLYYFALGAADNSWQLARIASKHAFPLFTIALALAPLVLTAIPAYRGRSRSFLEAATRAWPFAALAIYIISASDVSATPLHAFEGVTVPLAILSVQGMRRMRFARVTSIPVVATALVGAVTIPGIAFELNQVTGIVAPSGGNPNFISRDEQRALRYLAHDPVSGGVLTRFYLGTVVPGATGRRTFVGDCLWSEPRCGPRAQIAQMIFDGTLPAYSARAFVLDTGARFVLADCEARPDMAAVLAPITASVEHFGCATVYELTGAGPPSSALAESPPDAALRASGRQHRGVESS